MLDANTANYDKRNLKGLLPSELNFKQYDDSLSCSELPAGCKEPEYLFAVATSEHEFFATELMRTSLNISIFPSLNPAITFLSAALSEENYRGAAAALKMKVETKDHGIMLEYNKNAKETFYPFTQQEKHEMMEHILNFEIDLKR